MELFEAAFRALTPLAAAAVTSVLAFYGFLLTPLGGRIFDAILKKYFDNKLAELKHSQEKTLLEIKHENDVKISALNFVRQKEIESLKSDIAVLGNRGIQANEKEYAAIILCWESFIEAHQNTLACVAKMSTRADLDQMDEDDVAPHLEAMSISRFNIKYIMNSENRNSAYGKVLRAMDLDEARKSIFQARNVLRKQTLFLVPELEKEVESAISELQKVWAEQQISFPSSVGLPMTATMAFMSGGADTLRIKVRDVVRRRTLYSREFGGNVEERDADGPTKN